MRFLALVWLACCSFSLQAQPWDALRGLAPGDKIRVTDTSHTIYTGSFKALAERGISVETRRGAVEVERARIQRVEVHAGSRRVRNILIGAGIGLAVGILIDQTAGTYTRNEIGENAGVRAATYIAPAALFAGIGALLPAYRTIYRAR